MLIQCSRRARFVAVALASAAACSSMVPLTASAASLKPLVVQHSEVTNSFGSGFKTMAMRPMITSDVTNVVPSIAPITSRLMKGYVTGYFSGFYRPLVVRSGNSMTIKPGVSIVTSGVSVYRSTTYPGGAIDLAMKSRARILSAFRAPHLTGVHLDLVSGLGDKALVLVYSLTTPALSPGGTVSKTMSVTFIFSRGRFAATVDVTGQGSVSKSQAMALAKRVDDRIAHAG